MYEIIASVIVSVGGAGLIILGLSSWLGKVWATRIMQKERQELSKGLESYKSELEERMNGLRHKYDKIIQSRDFAVDSQVAYVVHSKYLEFADKYIKALRIVLGKLHGDGPSKNALMLESELRDIRFEYFIYIPESIDSHLRDFEYLFRTLGAKSGFAETLWRPEARSNAWDEADALFFKIIGETDKDKEGAANNLIRLIKDSLAISSINENFVNSMNCHN